MNHSSTDSSTDGWLRSIVATSVVLHLVVLFWHGAAHAGIPVPLTSVQWAFVIVVIYVLPVAGGIFVWTERRVAGAWLVTLSMFASLVFGFINHFMRASPDYVLLVRRLRRTPRGDGERWHCRRRRCGRVVDRRTPDMRRLLEGAAAAALGSTLAGTSSAWAPQPSSVVNARRPLPGTDMTSSRSFGFPSAGTSSHRDDGSPFPLGRASARAGTNPGQCADAAVDISEPCTLASQRKKEGG